MGISLLDNGSLNYGYGSIMVNYNHDCIYKYMISH